MTEGGFGFDLDPNVTLDPRKMNQETIDQRKTYETVLASFFLALTMVLGLVGNIAVISVICLYRNLRKDISNFLIMNLCITDLANSMFIMLSALISIAINRWPFGKFWCDCVCALNYCLIIVSMLTLCCISIDRYQAVMYPLTYRSIITKKRLLIVIIYTWLQGLAFGIAPSLSNWVDYDYWEAVCAIQWHLYRPDTIIYVVTAFILCFLGPGLVLVYCYVKILKEVNKQKVQVLAMNKEGRRVTKTENLSEKSRIVWSLLVVVFAYFICTTPFSVTKLIKVFVSGNDTIPGSINLTSALLGYVASAINPLIYGIFRKDFRRAYTLLLKKLCLQKCTQFEIFNTDETSKKPSSYRSEFDNVTMNITGSEALESNSKDNQDKLTEEGQESPCSNRSVSQINIVSKEYFNQHNTATRLSKYNMNKTLGRAHNNGMTQVVDLEHSCTLQIPERQRLNGILKTADSQHNERLQTADPQYKGILQTTNGHHNGILKTADPQHYDILQTTEGQHNGIIKTANVQHSGILQIANLQHNDMLQTANGLYNDILPIATPQQSDNLETANEQHNGILPTAKEQHNDILQTGEGQHNDISQTADPLQNGITAEGPQDTTMAHCHKIHVKALIN